LGAPTSLPVSAAQAQTRWLDGWALTTPAARQKKANIIEQARGSEAVFSLKLPLKPMIRGMARLRSGKNPDKRGVPIEGRASIVVSAGGRDQRVVEHAFRMPGEFTSFSWNKPLDDFAGETVTLTLTVDPGEALPRAPQTHRLLRVHWVDLRVEGFEPAEPAQP
jgi:hypothetical protein